MRKQKKTSFHFFVPGDNQLVLLGPAAAARCTISINEVVEEVRFLSGSLVDLFSSMYCGVQT